MNYSVEDKIFSLSNEIKIQMISVGSKATKLCQKIYPEIVSALYRAKPSVPPTLSLYWVNSNDSLMIRALIQQADFTYIVASADDKDAVQAVVEATQCEKDSFTITAWLQSNDAPCEIPQMTPPYIETTRQTIGIPFWDICASYYIISFIGIDWRDISDAFRHYSHFSFIEINQSKEKILSEKEIQSVVKAISTTNRLQNVTVITSVKKSYDLAHVEAVLDEINSFLPDNVSVIHNLWFVEDNVQEDDMVIRIYYGKSNENEGLI